MPSVSYLKNLLKSQISPRTDSDEEFLRLLQEADLRLLEFGKWAWTRARVELTPVDGYVTLPSTCASILGAQVGGSAKDIRAEFFEFTPEGIGEVEVGSGGTIRLIDQGLNDLGRRYYKVTGVFDDTVPIVAICHKAPVTLYDPDTADSDTPDDVTDQTVCPDVAALKLMMLGIIFEEANDMDASSRYVATALRTLDNKEKTQRGGARQQFNVRPMGQGIRSIPSFR